MVNKQLFSKKPDLETVISLLKLYGIDEFDTNVVFSREDLSKKNIITNLINFKPNLEKYYLPCKSKKYLTNINIKRSVTILRQVIREYNYKIISNEKYHLGKKYLSYKIIKLNKIIKEPNLVVKFD